MSHLPNPRSHWAGASDAELIATRDELRTHPDQWLQDIADDIDDDLERRAEYRRRKENA